jgi:hypothetical protein
MSFVLYLVLMAGRTRVLLESLVSLTRHAKVIWHRFLSLPIRLRQLRSRLHLRRISQQSIRRRSLRQFLQSNLLVSQHPDQLPIRHGCQQRIRRSIRQRCQRNILPKIQRSFLRNSQPNILLPALPRRQLFQSSSMCQKSHSTVVPPSSMQLKSAVFRALMGHPTALWV